MTTERFTLALSRLEAVVTRLEAIAKRPAAGSQSVAELEARHERLRAGTAEALARLDRLIASQNDRGA